MKLSNIHLIPVDSAIARVSLKNHILKLTCAHDDMLRIFINSIEVRKFFPSSTFDKIIAIMKEYFLQTITVNTKYRGFLVSILDVDQLYVEFTDGINDNVYMVSINEDDHTECSNINSTMLKFASGFLIGALTIGILFMIKK